MKNCLSKKGIYKATFCIIIYYIFMFTHTMLPFYVSIFSFLNLSSLFRLLSNNNSSIYEIYLNIYFNTVIYLSLFIILFPIVKNVIIENIQSLKSKNKLLLNLISDHLLFNIFNLISISIISTFIDIPQSINQEVSTNIIRQSPLISAFSILFAGPVVEEIIFRYSLFSIVCYILFLILKKVFPEKVICNVCKITFVVLSGVVFGLLHVQSGDYLAVFPYIIGGIFFSYIYIKNNYNLLYVMLLHILVNLFSFILVFLNTR